MVHLEGTCKDPRVQLPDRCTAAALQGKPLNAANAMLPDSGVVLLFYFFPPSRMTDV